MTSRPDVLVVYLNEARVGVLTDSGGRVEFTYDAHYLLRPDATPLSLSLALTADHHDPRVVEAFLWGLLPDNETTLGHLATAARTSAGNLLGLLGYVGRDTAGAIEILPEEVDPSQPGGVDWLTLDDLTERVAEVRRSAATGTPIRHDNGRWSLAGAQGKLALRHEAGQWGVPYGSEPTTHILKPAVAGFDSFDVHEAVLQRAARKLGLPAAASSVLRLADGTHVLVSERYDRTFDGQAWSRVHQEDLCQSLGVRPNQKYQSDGGPGVGQIGALLQRLPGARAHESARRFFDALSYNYALAATDGHAKNYSLLLAGPDATLAPLYDVNSALPYTRPYGRRYRSTAKLHSAFRHGTTDAFTRITRDDWSRVAEVLGLVSSAAHERLLELVDRVPDAVGSSAIEVADEAGLDPSKATPWRRLLTDYHEQLAIRA